MKIKNAIPYIILQQGGSIKYNPTESNTELPEIEGYKPQFSNFWYGGDETKKEESVPVQETTEVETQVEPQKETVPVQKTPIQTKTSKKYTDRNEFISEMTDAYSKALKLRNINPDYASYLAIQDAWESNFGKSYVGNWNYGNITVGSSGASYTEGKDHDGYGKQIINKFRNYNSLNDYINNKIDLLSGKRYRAFAGDLSGFYSRIKAGGYAGDPNYVNNLSNLYRQYFPVKGKKGLKISIFNNPDIPKVTDTIKNGSKTFTEMCAEFQNKVLRNSGYKTSNNAWNLNNADVYISGYTTLEKPKKYNNYNIQKYNKNAARNIEQNLNPDMLDRRQIYIANMYYNGSPFQEQAYNEGKDNITGTHTGYVKFNPDTNSWEVTHNIHGTVHVDSLNNILGSRGKYGVTALLKPQKQTIIDKIKDVGENIGKLIYQNGPFLNK